MARRLTPETKTLRYMINGTGMVACRASTRVRKLSFDLFGFIDVVGFKPRNAAGHELVGAGAVAWLCVQATSSDNQAARRRKILDDPVLRARAFDIIASGHRVEVWGWIRGRDAKTEGFRVSQLAGTTAAGLVWHDRGITEVPSELLVMPGR